MPDVRMVLLKGFDEQGFVFYTNFESAKGREILSRMKAAMCFHWKSLRRQVRIRGPVEIVSDAEADAYFATRPRGSRIGAWASKQSRPLESRFALEKAVAEYTARHAIGEIPRPKYWSGFRIVPQHDRVLARPAVPAARPDRVQPARRLGEDAALSVAIDAALPLTRIANLARSAASQAASRPSAGRGAKGLLLAGHEGDQGGARLVGFQPLLEMLRLPRGCAP